MPVLVTGGDTLLGEAVLDLLLASGSSAGRAGLRTSVEPGSVRPARAGLAVATVEPGDVGHLAAACLDAHTLVVLPSRDGEPGAPLSRGATDWSLAEVAPELGPSVRRLVAVVPRLGPSSGPSPGSDPWPGEVVLLRAGIVLRPPALRDGPARRLPDGPTFAGTAAPLTWLDLAHAIVAADARRGLAAGPDEDAPLQLVLDAVGAEAVDPARCAAALRRLGWRRPRWQQLRRTSDRRTGPRGQHGEDLLGDLGVGLERELGVPRRPLAAALDEAIRHPAEVPRDR